MANKFNFLVIFMGMKIREKLIMGFSLVLGLMIVIVLVAYVNLGTIAGTSGLMVTRYFPLTRTCVEIEGDVKQVIQGIGASTSAGNMEGMKQAKEVDAVLRRKFMSIGDTFEEGSDLKSLLGVIQKEYDTLITAGEKLVDANVFQKWAEIPEASREYTSVREKILEDIATLKEGGNVELQQAMNRINTKVGGTRNTTLSLGLVAVLLSILMVVGISMSIIKPINRIMALMDKAGHGDFTTTFDQASLNGRRDETALIGIAYNNMVNGISGIFSQVKKAEEEVIEASKSLVTISGRLKDGSERQSHSIQTARNSVDEMNKRITDVNKSVATLFASSENSNSSIFELSSSIEQIAKSSMDLSSSVSQTSRSIEAITGSIEEVARRTGSLTEQIADSLSALNEMDNSVREVENNANDSFKLTEKVAESVSGDGQETVQKAVSGVKKIHEMVSQAAEVIEQLGQRSEEIGKVLSVIREMTDQTNLLALNAAIIASQAGEHGRGFAVVAEEIKDLAERTGSSTKEITKIIEGIQDDSKKAVQAMQGGLKSVDEGVELIQEVDNTLSKAAMDSESASSASKLIAKATAEQAKGVRQVSKSTENISQMSTEISTATREQSLGGEQIKAAVENMSKVADQLTKATSEQSSGAKLISKSCEDASEMAKRILKATEEETKEAQTVLGSIEQVRDIAEENINMVKDVEQMTKSLLHQADMLKESVEKFRIGGGGLSEPEVSAPIESGQTQKS